MPYPPSPQKSRTLRRFTGTNPAQDVGYRYASPGESGLAAVYPGVYGYRYAAAADIDYPGPALPVSDPPQGLLHDWPNYQLPAAHYDQILHCVSLGLVVCPLPVVPENFSAIGPESFAGQRRPSPISSSRRRIAGLIRCIGTPA